MEKINIAELLKDCPKGMELDCTMYENVEFDYIEQNSELVYPIHCLMKINGGYNALVFTRNGCNDMHPNAKCVIFPKGKTTWEGFVPPCQFKDGDIIFTNTNALKCNLENSWVSIFKEYRNNRCACYVCLCLSDLELYHDKWEDELLCELCEIEENRLATEEEKEKLFKAIKANGYKWNEETKTLEKLPKFKVGDWVEFKYYERKPAKVIRIENNVYYLSSGDTLMFQDEHAWDLTTNKFDITTLKVFDKVLVRDHNAQEWVASLFSNYNEPKKYKYICVNGSGYAQCIPYEENKHLVGTKNDCDEYYKTWE